MDMALSICSQSQERLYRVGFGGQILAGQPRRGAAISVPLG